MKRLVEQLDGVLVRQAAALADEVRAGLRASLDPNEILRLWNETHRDSTAVAPKDARDWAKTHLRPDSSRLSRALDRVYGVGGALGYDASLQAYAKAKLSKAIDPADIANAVNIDWASWKPGSKAASMIAHPKGGFGRLYSRKTTTLDGLNETTLNRVGTALSAGLALGLADEQIASKLVEVIGSADRALTIATTEMNSAMSLASMDNYQTLGVEMVEWLGLEACEICEPNIEQGPIPLGQEFDSGDTEPPGHANCRCSILPVVDDGAAVAQDVVEPIPVGETSAIEEVAPVEPITYEALQNATKAEAQQAIADYYQSFEHEGFTLETSIDRDSATTIYVNGVVKMGENKVGEFARTIFAGQSVFHNELVLETQYQNKGFASAFNKHSEVLYKSLGVSKILLNASLETGGYAWAKAGYSWFLGKNGTVYTPFSVISSIEKWLGNPANTSQEAAAILSKFKNNPDTVSAWASPLEIANTKDDLGNSIGKDLLLGTDWKGEKIIQ